MNLRSNKLKKKTRNSGNLLPCSMPYLLSHRNSTLTVSQQVTWIIQRIDCMSYKVLSLRTRNKIVQFCHEALQQTTFLTQHQPLPLSCSNQPGGQSISIPTHPQLSQETTKPQNLCFPPVRDMGTNYKTTYHNGFKSHSKWGVTELWGLWQVSK